VSDDQIDLPLDPQHFTRRANKVSRKAHKKRYRLPVLQPSLPVADERFTPVEGVPKTRGECPVERPCPHVRCSAHLWLVDADTRAGRPGLSSVPRDGRGLTLATPGDAGTSRPGTTLRPGWLQVRGLEVEREVKVYVTKTPDGYELLDINHGRLSYWLAHLRMGEPVLVFSDDTAEMVAKARLTPDGLAFDRELPEALLCSSSAVVLTRVREVASCALDLIDQHGKMTNEQVGAVLARHRTLVGREAREALKKAVAEGKRRGIEGEDLVGSLLELGSVSVR
jgi:hypothetical protein